ncbi:hypothetical protein D3C87_2079280 [compost metagenome]
MLLGNPTLAQVEKASDLLESHPLQIMLPQDQPLAWRQLLHRRAQARRYLAPGQIVIGAGAMIGETVGDIKRGVFQHEPQR